jgi:hypothetical protein
VIDFASLISRNKLVVVILVGCFSLISVMAAPAFKYIQYQGKEAIKTEVQEEMYSVMENELKAITGELRKVSSLMEENYKMTKIAYSYSISEMIRFIEKQYTKITKNPEDFYASDLKKIVNETWPSLPDEFKNEELIIKYNVLLKYYTENLL